MNLSQFISQIPDKDKTPLVLQLLEIIQMQSDEIQHLRDEIAILKGQKPKPNIKPSRLEEENNKTINDVSKSSDKRPGSAKKRKTETLIIHEEKVISPDSIPPDSKFKGYQEYVVQDLIIQPFNVKYKLERWVTPNGENIVGTLPDEIKGSHFGRTLKCFILYQYYHCHVTEPLIYEQLCEMGICISSGQINSILINDKEKYHEEKELILKVGLQISKFIQVDDTGARHNGKNGYCTHIGNELFAYFESTESKSRINFLKILRAGEDNYAINTDAIAYMEASNLPLYIIKQFSELACSFFDNDKSWNDQLEALGITNPQHIQIATEGALLGSVIENGINPDIVILSDDAGQFNILLHGLCWIHAERTINKLVGYSEEQRVALEKKRSEIWDYYKELKIYKGNPSEEEKNRLECRFDVIFSDKTCFASLNKALERIYKNKNELLLVLKRPEIPLHNNLSESDIREYVKRRKISGSTRSSPGRKCRDTFTSLKKTCRKLCISFWNYLQDRLSNTSKEIPYLPELMRERACETGM